jgi:signal transduction histidine kinase
VELEDEGDDVRVAVLDVRQYHRNLVLAGPSQSRIDDLERAYAALLEELGELEQLASRDPTVPHPSPIRHTAERYYADFRSAVDRYETDPAALARASEHGMVRLTALQSFAEMLDQLGERRAAASLQQVDDVTGTARLVLLVVIGGLVLVGLVLAYAAMRIYARQQATSEALAAASQAKTELIADVSHDLRTPLTVLRGNAEVGLDIGRGCKHTPMLEEIVKVSAAMSQMAEDLQLFVRSDVASAPLKQETIEVVPFLNELAARAEALARQHGGHPNPP